MVPDIYIYTYNNWLVVSNMNFIFPFHIWDVILPSTNSIISQRGRSTTNQYVYIYITYNRQQ